MWDKFTKKCICIHIHFYTYTYPYVHALYIVHTFNINAKSECLYTIIYIYILHYRSSLTNVLISRTYYVNNDNSYYRCSESR